MISLSFRLNTQIGIFVTVFFVVCLFCARLHNGAAEPIDIHSECACVAAAGKLPFRWCTLSIFSHFLLFFIFDSLKPYGIVCDAQIMRIRFFTFYVAYVKGYELATHLYFGCLLVFIFHLPDNNDVSFSFITSPLMPFYWIFLWSSMMVSSFRISFFHAGV